MGVSAAKSARDPTVLFRPWARLGEPGMLAAARGVAVTRPPPDDVAGGGPRRTRLVDSCWWKPGATEVPEGSATAAWVEAGGPPPHRRSFIAAPRDPMRKFSVSAPRVVDGAPVSERGRKP